MIDGFGFAGKLGMLILSLKFGSTIEVYGFWGR